MRTLVIRGLAAVAVATLALACGPSRPQRPLSQPEPQQPINAPSTQPPMQPIEEPVAQKPLPSAGPQVPASEPVPQKPWIPPEESVRGPEQKPLTDAEVLGVTEEANRREIEMANLAVKKAKTPEVKKFANEMRSTHQKALDTEKKLGHKAKMAPAESDTTTTLKTETDQTLKELRDKTGKDFDRAYMDAQVKLHKDTLDMIDNRLMPAAQNGDVKSMLTDMRQKVADHLSKAEDARNKIEQAPPPAVKHPAGKKGKAAPAHPKK